METGLIGKQLKAIAHKSHTATVVATSLALRSRLRHESDITRTKNALIRDGEKIVESDYMQFWKDIQMAGAGVIVYGRKDAPDRFKWHYSLKKVAEGMLNGTDVSSSSKETSSEAPKVEAKQNAPPKTILRKAELKAVPKQEKTQAAPVAHKQVFIPLRDGFDLEFQVPSNLSKSEVETIVRALSRVAL